MYQRRYNSAAVLIHLFCTDCWLHAVAAQPVEIEVQSLLRGSCPFGMLMTLMVNGKNR